MVYDALLKEQCRVGEKFSSIPELVSSKWNEIRHMHTWFSFLLSMPLAQNWNVEFILIGSLRKVLQSEMETLLSLNLNQQKQHLKPQRKCKRQLSRTTMPYPSMTSLLPCSSWLLHPSQMNSRKAHSATLSRAKAKSRNMIRFSRSKNWSTSYRRMPFHLSTST